MSRGPAANGGSCPPGFPNWSTVYGLFWRWRNEGLWQKLHDALRAKTRRQAGRRFPVGSGTWPSIRWDWSWPWWCIRPIDKIKMEPVRSRKPDTRNPHRQNRSKEKPSWMYSCGLVITPQRDIGPGTCQVCGNRRPCPQAVAIMTAPQKTAAKVQKRLAIKNRPAICTSPGRVPVWCSRAPADGESAVKGWS